MSGLPGVVREAALQAHEELAEREAAEAQATADLFGRPAVPTVRAALPLPQAAEDEARRRRGRPPGAQNVSTVQWRKYLFGPGRAMPQKFLGDWLLVSPEELAQRLGCTVLEAFDRQRAIAAELAPYAMAKAAPVDENGKPVPFLQFNFGSEEAAQVLPPWEIERREIARGATVIEARPEDEA